MKVVLIAESEDTINEYTSFLEQAGADVITYRWFLKALDNLTEIQPHIIIVSALDFPRHWKTLFTHIEAGEFKNQPLVYLITDKSFTDSEKKKAMFLGAQDIFLSPLTNRDKNSLLSMLPAGMGIEAPPKMEPLPVDEPAAETSVESEAAPEAAETPAKAPSFDDPVAEPAPEAAVESEPAPEAEEEVGGEYAALMAQAEEAAVSEADVPVAEDAPDYSFPEESEDSLLDDTVVPPSVSLNDFPAADDIPTNDDLVVASAEEDILTRIEDEMTIKEIPDDLKDTPAPEPEPEPEPAPEPEAEPEPEERPEQITWSAPVADDEPAPAVQETPAAEEEIVEEEYPEGFVTFSFQNPSTGMVVTGTVDTYDHPTIKFVPDSQEAIAGIRFGQILEQCKFTFEGETVKARAQVRGLGKVIEFCLLY